MHFGNFRHLLLECGEKQLLIKGTCAKNDTGDVKMLAYFFTSNTLSIRPGKIIYSFIITARMNFCCRIAIEFYFLFAYFHLVIDIEISKITFFILTRYLHATYLSLVIQTQHKHAI